MSEPILRALMQLFALISDIGNINEISPREKEVVRSFLARHLNNELIEKYLMIFDDYLDLYINREAIREGTAGDDIASLKTLRIKRICEGINKELRLKQKVYIVIQLTDFISYGKEITENELDFLMTVALALNIQENEYRSIKSFIIDPVSKVREKERLLLINSNKTCKFSKIKHIYSPNLTGEITFLHVASTKAFILRYNGEMNLYLNGQPIFSRQSYFFDNGSTLKGQGINTLYYPEVYRYFHEAGPEARVNLTASRVTYRFSNSENGIQTFDFSGESGQLVGILGVSGTGKSTLLNLLNGNLKPQSGNVFINGYNINNPRNSLILKGIIGYIPQDDLLIDELTVFQNVYFNARLCLSNFPEPRIRKIVTRMLIDLDLWGVRNLKVGNPLDKVISGGQRKRINIALELVREPFILFVDEPTSGLSSVDSEVVMNLLKEQTYKGKLVLVNIHQPGSELFKLFDKIIILDKGGYQIFYGNPNEAIVYFKTLSRQANPEEDQCIKCGNINVDQLLQIVEARIVDEHGKVTQTRKILPEEWAYMFRQKFRSLVSPVHELKRKLPESFYSIPGRLRQMGIFFERDVLSKLGNTLYILIAFLGAPLLALLIGYFTRYVKGESYQFIDNDNLPAYMFMCVITSMFLGLMMSSEEIFKDRKILKRESFLGLSWFSYINSKIALMFVISAIQSILFILAGNTVLGIRGLTFHYWLVLFTTSCCANLIGLNISSAFNSVITIYILIPFILIPQLLFSGVLVKYDKLHIARSSSSDVVPVIGELMTARWSFEALAVEQFKNNRYERIFYPLESGKSNDDWYGFYLPSILKRYAQDCERADGDDNTIKDKKYKLSRYLEEMSDASGYEFPESLKESLAGEKPDQRTFRQVRYYIDTISKYFMKQVRLKTARKDSVSQSILKTENGSRMLAQLKADYYNNGLAVMLLNEDVPGKSVEKERTIIRKLEPAYMHPTRKNGRAHFYAPFKSVGSFNIDTFWFNLLVIWMVSLILYLCLYFTLLRKTVSLFGKIRVKKPDSNFLVINEISSW